MTDQWRPKFEEAAKLLDDEVFNELIPHLNTQLKTYYLSKDDMLSKEFTEEQLDFDIAEQVDGEHKEIRLNSKCYGISVSIKQLNEGNK